MNASELRAQLAACLADEQAWFVGGTVRDELLGRSTEDVDVAVTGDVERITKAVAKQLNAPAFPLSTEFGTWRVVGDGWQVDISVLQGETLLDDLGRRDFTINAMALPVCGGELIDPTSGRADLNRQVLRAASDSSLADDPIRTLRLVRLACGLGFDVDPHTAATARLQAPGLADTAGERIFAELALILSSEAVLGGLSLMSEFGLMAQVLPEVSSLKDVEQNRYHHLDVYEHTLLVLEQVMRLQHDPAAVLGGVDQRCIERISGLLGERLADDLTRGTALRFGALLHDVAKPQTQARGADGTVLGFPDHAAQGAALVTEICARMRTSDRLSKYLAALTRHHLGLGFLVHADPLDARAVYRYLAATAPEQVDVSLLSIADRLATLGHKAEVSTLRHLEVARRVLPDALQFDAFLAQAPLVRGDVLAAELGLAPGPELGAMLEAITEARFAGEVSSEADAIAYARRL